MRVSATLLLLMLMYGTSRAQTTGPVPGLSPLADEPSRGALFAKVVDAAKIARPETTAESSKWFSLLGPFKFPDDVSFDRALNKPRPAEVFGVDISHYTPATFPIELLRQKQATFVYIKTSQGARAYDPKFAAFWKRAAALPDGHQVHRGAYHFLTSADDPHAQARTFVAVLKANGGLKDTDMPPVVDLEWDIARKDGPDRWASKSPDQIIASVKAFAEDVKAATGRNPMIYTARAWWKGRIGPESRIASLSSYPLWIADYSTTARASETPPMIGGTPWTLWQYTDGAKMAIGYPSGFDASVFKGTPDELLSSLGVKDFQ